MNKKLKSILRKEKLGHLLKIFKAQGINDTIIGDLTGDILMEFGIDKLEEQERLLNAFSAISIGPTLNMMVEVKGGKLPKSSELADTKVGNFKIGMYTVNEREWNRVIYFAKKNNIEINGELRECRFGYPVTGVSWYRCALWCNAKSIMEDLHPVYRLDYSNPIHTEVISWADGYRMPTEAEWEWAARGGKKSQGYTFAGSNNLNDVGWYAENTRNMYTVTAVGGKSPNELGLFDMSGGVWEWCWDSSDNRAESSARYLRGGSFYNFENYCSVAYRGTTCYEPNIGGCYVGFRLARS
jgi:sulfatase modifying factor 1